MRWEYHFQMFQPLNVAEAMKEPGPHDHSGGFNALGDEGWEMVTTAVNTAGQLQFVFKRPKPD